jgi:hypothetical protein
MRHDHRAAHLHHVPGRDQELGDCDEKVSAIDGYSPKEEAAADYFANLEGGEPTVECA